MKNYKVLNFDMDGTLAGFYDVPEWLEKIRAFDASPYLDAKPMLQMNQLARQLNRLQNQGYKLRVLTWSSKESTPEFDELVRQTKMAWLEKHLPSVHWDEIIVTEYGVEKSTLGHRRGGILFDDNAEVRKTWRGTAFPETEIMSVLKSLGR